MNDSHYGITRLKKAKAAWCWNVVLSRRGKTFSKAFYDESLGGKAAALRAAIAWRDEVARTEVLTFRDFHEHQRSNNTSGVPGVCLVKSAAQPEGTWQAMIKPEGKRKMTRSFSIKKFGEREAFSLAVAARKEMLDALEDRLYLRSATAKRLARK